MLFSCLIDADFLDTEQFMDPKQNKIRNQKQNNFSELRDKLEQYISTLKQDSDINVARSKFLKQCQNHGKNADNGFYSLFLPTGGGKTLSSMMWALENAINKKKDRIIYVIPYTSIISQTAKIFKAIFGNENVLEHHSDLDIEDEEKFNRNKLLSENWNIPIIVTTNVQFFESLYSHKVGRCRKLHNICNAVVIFDEAQMFPASLLTPMLRATKCLNQSFGTQILFCTATLPIFDKELNIKTKKGRGFYQIPKIEPVVAYEENLFSPFDKVEYHICNNELTFIELSKELLEHDSFLCIVNTRKDAASLFQNLTELYKDNDLIHLSRQMCSDHISEKLDEIKSRLKEGKPTKVVATQLVEAGVDLDFPIVYRAFIGLDSIIQAGGRCNREGRLPKGHLYTFKLRDGSKLSGEFNFSQYATEDLLAQLKEEKWKVYDPQTVERYYLKFYSRIPDFDEQEIEKCLWTSDRCEDFRFDFEEASKKFRYIDDNKYKVIVPYKDFGLEIIRKIESGKKLTKRDFRKMKRLEVGISKMHLEELMGRGSVVLKKWGNAEIYLMTDKDSYNNNIGIQMENHWLQEEIVI